MLAHTNLMWVLLPIFRNRVVWFFFVLFCFVLFCFQSLRKYAFVGVKATRGGERGQREGSDVRGSGFGVQGWAGARLRSPGSRVWGKEGVVAGSGQGGEGGCSTMTMMMTTTMTTQHPFVCFCWLRRNKHCVDMLLSLLILLPTWQTYCQGESVFFSADKEPTWSSLSNLANKASPPASCLILYNHWLYSVNTVSPVAAASL